MNGNYLKKLRKQNLCSQSKLALITGIGRFKISQIENDYVKVEKSELKIILNTLRKIKKETRGLS